MMRRQTYMVGLWLLAMANTASAELPPQQLPNPSSAPGSRTAAPYYPPNPNASSPSNAPPNRGIQIFDDRVFDLSSEQPPPPATSRSPYSGTERAMGAEPTYNTEQRQQWIDSCQGARNQDPKAFRNCFENKKKESSDALERRLGDVQKPQTQVPLMEESSSGGSREPAFQGTDADKK